MMKQEDILRLHREALAELKKVPGVLNVGYGLRECSGKVTRDVAFRVYVRKKKPRRNLSMAEIVPAAFKGIPTDVLEENWFVPDDCADHPTN